MIAWILSKLFPYRPIEVRCDKGDVDGWAIRKTKENMREYGGYNIQN